MRRSCIVLTDLQDLKSETTDVLISLWRELYGTGPPAGIRRETILRFVFFKVQEVQQGSLSTSSLSMIKLLQGQFKTPQGGKARSLEILYPGVRLIRDWRGERHDVKVLERGFEYQGEHYSSLTAIATAITGTKRSGPLFFGLRGDRR